MKRLVIRSFVLSILGLAVIAGACQAQAPGSIDRLDPAMDRIVASDSKLEPLADTPGQGPREGPLWIRNGGFLLYTDFAGNAINRWNPADGKATVFLEKSESNGLTLDREGRIVYAAKGKLMRLEENGNRTVLASEYEGKPLNVPNDLVIKSDGVVYFTDPGNPRAHTSYIYMLKSGTLTRFTEETIDFPNGLAFSPNEKYLYINDMMQKTILRYEVRPDDSITNRKLFFAEDPQKKSPYPAEGYPDGMKVDKKGNIYCTGLGRSMGDFAQG